MNKTQKNPQKPSRKLQPKSKNKSGHHPANKVMPESMPKSVQKPGSKKNPSSKSQSKKWGNSAHKKTAAASEKKQKTQKPAPVKTASSSRILQSLGDNSRTGNLLGIGSRYVYGKNSVKAIFETNPTTVSKLYLSETLKPDKRIQDSLAIAARHKIMVQRVPKQKLDQLLCNTQPPDQGRHAPVLPERSSAAHQGIIAAVAAKPILDFTAICDMLDKALVQQTKPVVLILDGITDPRNLGALLRVADGCGVACVLLPRHNSVGLSPAVSKTASGAEETVTVGTIGNISQAVQTLKTKGFWVYGAAVGSKTMPYTQAQFDTPVVLILGSEENGIGPGVQKHCDALLSIPMQGHVSSLNVSTAGAVLLYEIVRQNA
ncbi:MAG: 23S rRNA (guanosine(2251)-2'-O)-methyltransferase RlmB [Cyanobacteria bacterium P01_H01_bin.74]